MATRLMGWAAIEFAEKNGCRVSKKADSSEAARDDVLVDEAKEIARKRPELIYVDFDELPPTNVA